MTLDVPSQICNERFGFFESVFQLHLPLEAFLVFQPLPQTVIFLL